MNTSQIIKGVIGGGRYTVTAPIVKEDYGLYLKIEGLELPSTYEVDFSNSEHNGTSVTMIGNSDGVIIPSQFISSGKDVFAFLYHVGADYGRTVYKFRIPNKLRPDRTDEQPTPEEQSVIDQTISALNDAVESAQEAQEAIENMSVSAQTLAEGASATVTKTEQGGVVHLEFGIPKGQTGDSPTITASKPGKTTYIYVDGSEIAQIEDGTDGTNGDDGYSPTASVSKSGKAATITITDQNGTTSAQVEDGTDGTDGVSPTVTITPITGGHRITITDKDGEHSADVMDGTGNVDDVQIDGTSIVQDGVANVPIAAKDVYGTVKFGYGSVLNWYGLFTESNGSIAIAGATDSDIKGSWGAYKPIVPQNQHKSVFYGLAKAAGDTTQSQSSNAVGNYTDTAKGKIHDMLGIGVAKELRAYSELGEDMDLIEIPLPDRYEKVWFRFMCRINNAENNLANGQTQMLAWLGDSTNFSTGQDPSIYESAYIRQLDTFMIKGWFVVDFPFVERFSTQSYGATNWSQGQTVRSQDGSYQYENTKYDKLTSYPHSLFVRPYDTSKGYLFKANSQLGVYVK